MPTGHLRASGGGGEGGGAGSGSASGGRAGRACRHVDRGGGGGCKGGLGCTFKTNRQGLPPPSPHPPPDPDAAGVQDQISVSEQHWGNASAILFLEIPKTIKDIK